MTPRFATYVPFPSSTLSLDTDGNGAQQTTLPAGIYAWLGVAPTKCGVTSASATVNVDSGAQFNAGDAVTIYDVSANAVLATATVVSSTSSTVVLDTAVTTSTSDVLYLTGDLCGTLEALLAATDVANDSESFRLRPNTSNPTLADVYYSGGFTGTLTLDSYTADVLRLSTSESVPDAAGGVVSERSVLGTFAPSKTIVDDRPKKMRPGFSSVSDDGTFRKLTIAQQTRHTLEVRYRGGPRATDWSEIHAWEDMCDLLDAGYKFRLYRDTDTTTAVYARKTNPYGWQEWHVERGAEFEPRNPVGGTYDNWTQVLNLIEAAA